MRIFKLAALLSLFYFMTTAPLAIASDSTEKNEQNKAEIKKEGISDSKDNKESKSETEQELKKRIETQQSTTSEPEEDTEEDEEPDC